MTDDIPAASALVEALASLKAAERAINTALARMGKIGSAPDRLSPIHRTTSTQILAILSAHEDAMTLIDIADGVVAMRRGEDVPKGRGGTRYQEICRSSLARLIDRGLVERVDPTDKRGLMRFRRAEPRYDTNVDVSE